MADMDRTMLALALQHIKITDSEVDQTGNMERS